MSMDSEYMETKTESSGQIIQLNEIYYNCSECSSSIEIKSINEKEYSIEFKCIKNNHRIKMPIKDYITKMKKFNDKKINNDRCPFKNHNLEYVGYCINCKNHLCKECLKSRDHISHNKTMIIEIQPNNKELNIIENMIKSYEDKIEILEKEKLIKTMEISNKFREFKNKLDKQKESKMKENKYKMEKELKLKKDLYITNKKKYQKNIIIKKN